MLTVERLTSPAPPLTVAEARERCRVDHNDSDIEIAAMVAAACREFEDRAGVALITTTIRATFDPPPLSSRIPLPIGPVLAGATATVTLDGQPFTDFALITGNRPAIVLADDELVIGELVVTYSAGFGANRAAVPADVAQAILDQVAVAFDLRGMGDARGLAPGGLSHAFARVAARWRRVAA